MMSDVQNPQISIPQIANIIATKDASSPLYLKGPELVRFFNNLGFSDSYTFVEGRGIQTPDFGEGLSRLNYTMKRLVQLNKGMRIPEVITNLYSLFENQKESLSALEDALGKYARKVYCPLDQDHEKRNLKNDHFKGSKHNPIQDTDISLIEENPKFKELQELVLGPIPEGRKVVFLSYSWDNKEHQEWVSKLANDLTANGLYVLYDGYLKAGTPIDQFMELGMRRADKIILVGTNKYLERYYTVDSGVAFEGCLVRSNIVQCIGTNKIIPCLRTGDDFKSIFPMTLVSRKGYDFRDDEKYAEALNNLCRDIWERPRCVRPAIGPIPEYV